MTIRTLFSHNKPRYTGDIPVDVSVLPFDLFKIFMRLLHVIPLLAFILMAFPALAEDINGSAIKTSGLPLPRYVSLKSDKVYVRTGPSVRYPIRWIYQKSDIPVEIVEEFDVWRKIRDSEGEGASDDVPGIVTYEPMATASQPFECALNIIVPGMGSGAAVAAGLMGWMTRRRR